MKHILSLYKVIHLCRLYNGIFKHKCPTVKLQKKNEVTNHVFSWIPILVIPSVLMKDILPRFNRIIATWTTEIFSGKKLQPIFPNGSIISNCSCSSCTKRIRMPNILKPCIFFSI